MGTSEPKHNKMGTSEPKHNKMGTSTPKHSKMGTSTPKHNKMGTSTPKHNKMGTNFQTLARIYKRISLFRMAVKIAIVSLKYIIRLVFVIQARCVYCDLCQLETVLEHFHSKRAVFVKSVKEYGDSANCCLVMLSQFSSYERWR